ncbi:MAG: hypothetical protein GXO16_05780 [Epsilonproteobacteria bacterium]|nr:hypothetical protein [Campylobacterota bacterium]
MCEKDFEKFSAYLAGIAMTFDKTLDPMQINLYFEVLKDEFETFAEFKVAADNLLKTWFYSYMPKPAHFIQATQMDLELIAEQAYSAAKTAAIRHGVYKNIEFEDRAIETTILTLFTSWKEFHDRVAYIDSDDTWVKKDFIRTYKAIVKNKALKPIKLIGYLQSEFKDPVVVASEYTPPLFEADTNDGAQISEKTRKFLGVRKVG